MMAVWHAEFAAEAHAFEWVRLAVIGLLLCTSDNTVLLNESPGGGQVSTTTAICVGVEAQVLS